MGIEYLIRCARGGGLLVIVVMCAGCVIAGENFSFEMSFEPQRTEYWSDEPIAVEFRIKNTSAKPVFMYQSSGRDTFWVEFKSKDPAIVKRKSLEAVWENMFYSGLASQFDFKSGEMIAGHRFVNNTHDYRKPGVYEINFEFQMAYEPDAEWAKQALEFKTSGTFKITVLDKKLTVERLEAILKRWTDDRGVRSSVVQALTLVDDPLVMPLLVKYAREAPHTTGIAAVALRRFMGRKDGQEALEELGQEFGPEETYPHHGHPWPKERDNGEYVADRVFQSFLAMERAPSEKFLKAQLNSKNEGRVRAALDFLMDMRQRANQAPLDAMEKLAKHENAYIAKKASKVLEKISKQKVDADF